MRILFCTLGYEPGQVGGAERQARLQAEELVRRGHTVEVVCPSSRGVPSRPQQGVMVHRLPRLDRRPFRTITYLPILFIWLLARAGRFDLIHVHLANLQADIAAIAGAIVRVPTYVKLAAGGTRGEIARLRRIAWLTRYVGIRRARRVQAISHEIVRDLMSIGVTDDRIVRIPNGIRITDPTPDRYAIRARLDLPARSVLVLYAGRFARYKGVADLLEAWDQARLTEVTLVLVGEQAVDAPLDALPTGDGVIVRPWSDAIEGYLDACDIFVLPSHVEGMSNALLEAMLHGMAVVATNVGAAGEMIDPGQSGVLVEPGDVPSLATVIVDLVRDPAQRDALGTAARRTVIDRYAIEAVVGQIEDAYRAIAAEGRA